ncbi:hypothetical protein EB796_023306 [Bugula neritina]|uniref:Serine/threonine-protein phosphatase PGAM5, mitochondrial n=1 Tax=Bugula neritina TaxID=10212 RepID=A0A7J7IWZ4_BUGNE|nr:hypothetical protein EB796_023306 [Bugula neritina]
MAFRRFAITGIVGAGSLVMIKEYYEKSRVKASWTTHHNTPEPSRKWDDNWDCRRPTPCKEVDSSGDKEVAVPTATRHLILIRHGQYNLKGKQDQDRYLTELGKEQANMTGKRLKELNYPITKVVYSTMTRAQETGKIISSHLPEDVPVENCSLIEEGAPIPPEPPVGHWRPEAQQFFQEGARIEAGFRKYFHRADPNQKEASYEVLVCHANVIRYFVCRALQLPPEAWLRMSLHNGSMTFITIRPNGRVGVRAIGECGYMDPAKLSTT